MVTILHATIKQRTVTMSTTAGATGPRSCMMNPSITKLYLVCDSYDVQFLPLVLFALFLIPDINTLGADADGFSRDNPPYNINSLKGAMDWCSSQRPWQCTGVVATRVFPYHLEFIPKKGHTLVPSSLSFHPILNADYTLNETFENAYVRKDAPNPNATGTTNRMKYL